MADEPTNDDDGGVGGGGERRGPVNIKRVKVDRADVGSVNVSRVDLKTGEVKTLESDILNDIRDNIESLNKHVTEMVDYFKKTPLKEVQHDIDSLKKSIKGVFEVLSKHVDNLLDKLVTLENVERDTSAARKRLEERASSNPPRDDNETGERRGGERVIDDRRSKTSIGIQRELLQTIKDIHAALVSSNTIRSSGINITGLGEGAEGESSLNIQEASGGSVSHSIGETVSLFRIFERNMDLVQELTYGVRAYSGLFKNLTQVGNVYGEKTRKDIEDKYMKLIQKLVPENYRDREDFMRAVKEELDSLADSPEMRKHRSVIRKINGLLEEYYAGISRSSDLWERTVNMMSYMLVDLMENKFSSAVLEITNTFHRTAGDFMDLTKNIREWSREMERRGDLLVSGVGDLVDIINPMKGLFREQTVVVGDLLRDQNRRGGAMLLGNFGNTIDEVGETIRDLRNYIKEQGDPLFSRMYWRDTMDVVVSTFDILRMTNPRLAADSKMMRDYMLDQLDVQALIAANTGRTVEEIQEMNRRTREEISDLVNIGAVSEKQAELFADSITYLKTNAPTMAGVVQKFAESGGSPALFAHLFPREYSDLVRSGLAEQILPGLSEVARDYELGIIDRGEGIQRIQDIFRKLQGPENLGPSGILAYDRSITGRILTERGRLRDNLVESPETGFLVSAFRRIQEVFENYFPTEILKLVTSITANTIALGINTMALYQHAAVMGGGGMIGGILGGLLGKFKKLGGGLLGGLTSLVGGAAGSVSGGIFGTSLAAGASTIGKSLLRFLPLASAGYLGMQAMGDILDGDILGALIHGAGAGLSFIPGVGPLIGLGLSGAYGVGKGLLGGGDSPNPAKGYVSIEDRSTRQENGVAIILEQSLSVQSRMLDVLTMMAEDIRKISRSSQVIHSYSR